jgi:hypothetical protein
VGSGWLALATALAFASCVERASDRRITTVSSGGEVAIAVADDSAAPRPEAMVRVVNAIPGIAGVTVRTAGEQAFQTVEFQSVTPYAPVRDNWVEFSITRGGRGTDTTAFVNREMLADDGRYTMIVLSDGKGGIQSRVMRDDFSVDTARARVRVIHGAAGAGAIDVVWRGPARRSLFTGLVFGRDGEFEAVEPSRGAIEVRTTAGGHLIATTGTVSFERGASYSFVVTRDARGRPSVFGFHDIPVAASVVAAGS